MIKIVSPKTREDFKTYYDLRYKVLRETWGLQKGTEKDDYEPISHHFMAIEESSGEVIGVIKLFEKEAGVGWFSHMAVTPKYQHKGIGKMLLNFVEGEAKKEGYASLGCMARLNTTSFFEKAGYRINGLPTHYIGTTQVVWMEKTL
ncbi:MAG: GNAT family N-acetyltransferase [Chloroflexi bacterium]|nr:GNAT family N-acetyltransferase [Chloroflexota bacterium]